MLNITDWWLWWYDQNHFLSVLNVVHVVLDNWLYGILEGSLIFHILALWDCGWPSCLISAFTLSLVHRSKVARLLYTCIRVAQVISAAWGAWALQILCVSCCMQCFPLNVLHADRNCTRPTLRLAVLCCCCFKAVTVLLKKTKNQKKNPKNPTVYVLDLEQQRTSAVRESDGTLSQDLRQGFV